MKRRLFVTFAQWAALAAAAWPALAFLFHRPMRTRTVVFTPAEQQSAPLTKEGVHLVDLGETFLALSARCPHLGCSVRRTDTGEYACPCHGSRFDDRGALLAGPAAQGMDALPITLLENGDLAVTVEV